MREIEFVNGEKKVIVCHHDLDGITSASLVVRAIGKDVEVHVQDPNEKFSEIFANIVIIVDVAVTQQTFGSLTNIHAKKIIWIDHHKPFEDISSYLPANVQVIIDPASPSAVGLVRKFFGLNDEIAEKITDLGTKADTWKLEPIVEEWMNLDMAFSFKHRDKTPLIEALAQGKLEISGRLKRTLNSYLRKKERAKKKLLEFTLSKNIRGHSIAIGLAPALLSGSESADFLFKETNAEIQIILKYQGWMSIRRAKSSTVNLLDLAELWGGGGHEYASGASLGKHVTSRNLLKVAMEIFEEISSVI